MDLADGANAFAAVVSLFLNFVNERRFAAAQSYNDFIRYLRDKQHEDVIYWLEQNLRVANDIRAILSNDRLRIIRIDENVEHLVKALNARSAKQESPSELPATEVSNLDQLTGVYQRRYFDKKLREEIERANPPQEPLSIIIADIDRFKRVNDEHGHSTGDDTIKRFAELLTRSIGARHTLARLGGDEFVILLPTENLIDAVMRAEILRAHCESSPMKTRTAPVHITASFGIASLARDHNKATAAVTLLRDADYALYRAKERGRNGLIVADANGGSE